MAINKNSQIRYTILDQCFSNRFKKFFIDDLIEHCSLALSDFNGTETQVSRRQIFDDMRFMRDPIGYDAPIESIKEGKKTYYRYSDSTFTINTKPLNFQELETLKHALFTLNRMSSVSGFEWVNSLQTKLYSELNLGKNDNKIIDFEENEFLTGLHFLYPLYQYICNQQSLKIGYKSFQSSEIKEFELSPHYLKQYNNRWFLLSTGHKHDSIFTLAIDRIVAIEISNDKFRPTYLDFSEYFDEVIGVTNYPERQIEKIEIQLDSAIIPYIKSKPLHGSQKIKGDILTLHLKLNFELEGLILSYGENMTVLQPPILVEKIKERIGKMKLL